MVRLLIRYGCVLLLIGAGVLAVMWLPNEAGAGSRAGGPRRYCFGAMGVAPGEFLRINVSRPEAVPSVPIEQDSAAPLADEESLISTPAPTLDRLEIALFNEQGREVSRSEGQLPRGGRTYVYRADAESLGAKGTTAAVVRVEVRVIPEGPEGAPAEREVPTVEVADITTGRTRLLNATPMVW